MDSGIFEEGTPPKALTELSQLNSGSVGNIYVNSYSIGLSMIEEGVSLSPTQTLGHGPEGEPSYESIDELQKGNNSEPSYESIDELQKGNNSEPSYESIDELQNKPCGEMMQD